MQEIEARSIKTLRTARKMTLHRRYGTTPKMTHLLRQMAKSPMMALELMTTLTLQLLSPNSPGEFLAA